VYQVGNEIKWMNATWKIFGRLLDEAETGLSRPD
jgi:hypothetical protein